MEDAFSAYSIPNKQMVRKEKKMLSPEEKNQVDELKQQRSKILKEIQKIDPSTNSQAKRIAKRNEAMAYLLKLSKMNKDVKKVSWMNSRAAFEAQKQIDKSIADWEIDDTQDFSGDGTKDVIIYDEDGAIRGVNGNTITKSKYPERQLYTSAYPKLEDRKKVTDKATGKLKNENPMSFTEFKNVAINHFDVNHNTGKAVYTHPIKGGKELTPYKLFSKYIMKTYWNSLVEAGWLDQIPKHLRMSFYSKLKTNAWFYIKNWASNMFMNDGIYSSLTDDERTEVDKSPKMKTAIETTVSDIMQTDFDVTFNQLTDVFNAVLEGRGLMKKLPGSKLKTKHLSPFKTSDFNNFRMPARDPYEENLPIEDDFLQ